MKQLFASIYKFVMLTFDSLNFFSSNFLLLLLGRMLHCYWGIMLHCKTYTEKILIIFCYLQLLVIRPNILFQELEAIKARVKEMEEEAEKLKEMQSEVEKQMNMSNTSSNTSLSTFYVTDTRFI